MSADCFCSGCVPNDFKEVCSACGEEIRYGWREGRQAFWHREHVDHVPVHGHRSNPMLDRADRPEPEVEDKSIPPVEVWAHPVSPEDFPGTSGIRQIANLVSGVTRVNPETGKNSKSKKHPPAAPGWELVNITHARGPYLGSKGELLSVSDTHVLRARGPARLDGSVPIAVASWRDMDFDFGFVGVIKNGQLSPRKVTSTDMKDWIKQ